MKLDSRIEALAKLVVSFALLVAAVAGLTFVLRGGTAHAAPAAGGGNGRYQISGFWDPVDKGWTALMIDTSTGKMWDVGAISTGNGSGGNWEDPFKSATSDFSPK